MGGVVPIAVENESLKGLTVGWMCVDLGDAPLWLMIPLILLLVGKGEALFAVFFLALSGRVRRKN